MMKLRVKIPTNRPKDIIDLAKKVYDKHQADADSSLLKNLDWNEAGASISKAIKAHEKAEELSRETIKMYQQRDLLLEPLTEIVRNSRDILTGSYKKEMKKLGDWGFDVLDNKSSLQKQKPTVKS